MLARRVIRLERGATIVEVACMRAAQPVTVREPELAPLVRSLDVVVIGEALLEPPPRVVGLADRRRAQREHAIGRRLFVAITELAAMSETGLGLGVRVGIALE